MESLNQMQLNRKRASLSNAQTKNVKATQPKSEVKGQTKDVFKNVAHQMLLKH